MRIRDLLEMKIEGDSVEFERALFRAVMISLILFLSLHIVTVHDDIGLFPTMNGREDKIFSMRFRLNTPLMLFPA